MNKKVSLILIGALLLLSLIVLFFISKNDNNKNKVTLEGYLVINNDSIWAKYSNNSWKKEEYSKIDSKKMNIFIDNKYKGDYYLKYINNWNLFDESDNYVDYEGNFMAASPALNIAPIDMNSSEISLEDLNVINEIKNSSFKLDDLSSKNKVLVDLNSDGIKDEIINVSNIDSSDQNKYFSLIYTVIDGKKEILINEDIDIKNLYRVPMYDIKSIIKISDEKVNSIVIEKGYFSNVSDTGNILFRFFKESYKLVIED